MTIDPDAEPLFRDQWYLANTPGNRGTPGMDINIRSAWDLATGRGVRIAINDSGVNPEDPDLRANLDTSLGGNFNPNTAATGPGPDPEVPLTWHGTAVAAMAAAADNGTGFLGAAPEATLGSLVGIARPGALARYADYDVVNASWGVTELFADDFNAPRFAEAGAYIRRAAEDGRDGLGTVTVFAAGNDFTKRGFFGLESGVGDANYHNFQNSRHTLAVAALDDDGTFEAPNNPPGFTTPGAPVLVAAPGTQVRTADLPGAHGNDPGDTTTVQGTSFAAPLVSGVSALLLDANPDLGYRDVKQILAYTAQQNDPGQEQWRLNGADDWNGGGLHTNINYGFGLVDAAAAVRLAETWRKSDTADNEAQVSDTRARTVDFNTSTSPFEQTVDLGAGVEIETVAVDIALAHEHLGDVTVWLTSPAGTTSRLVHEPDGGDFGAFNKDGYRLTSNEFMGESSAGVWTLTVRDGAQGGLFSDTTEGRLFDWTLTAYGEPADGDDSYVYTDEYGAYAEAAPARQTLSDAGGTDTLNAAATSQAVAIDLSPGAESTIAGEPLTIAEDTTIENAAGGGGADTIRGNAAANRLHGGPGADTLRGRGGDDTLIGGRGADTLAGGPGTDSVVFDAPRSAVTFDRGNDGTARATLDGATDTLHGLEYASFTDAAMVALDSLLPEPEPGPPARVFLAADGAFSLTGTGTVFGRSGGDERVYLGEDARAVHLDANLERIDIARPLADLAFGVTADGFVITAQDGGPRIATLPSLNQPLDLHLADGRASLEQTGAQTFALTGEAGETATVTGPPAPVPLALDTAARPGPALADAGDPAPAGRVFLAEGGGFTLANPAEVFGRSGGAEALTLTAGAHGVELDANLERLDLPHALDSLRFGVDAGGLTITGEPGKLVTLPSLNQPMELRLAEGSASLEQTGAQTFTLTGGDDGTATIDGAPETPDIALGDDTADTVTLTGGARPGDADDGLMG